MLYKVGEEPIRDIAKKFGITHGAIQQRAKRENWVRGSLKTAVNELAKSASQVSQMVTQEEVPIINRIVKNKATLKAMITDIFGDAIELQQSIILGTLHKCYALDLYDF